MRALRPDTAPLRLAAVSSHELEPERQALEPAEVPMERFDDFGFPDGC